MAAQQEDHEKIGADARGSNDGNQDWICEFGRIDEAVNRLEDHGYAQRQLEDAVESSTENFGTLPSKAEPLSRAIVLFAIAAALRRRMQTTDTTYPIKSLVMWKASATRTSALLVKPMTSSATRKQAAMRMTP